MIEQQLTSETEFVPATDQKIELARILVATDFSPASDRALEHAVSLARWYNSKIYLTHILPLDVMMAPELVTVTEVEVRRAAETGMRRIEESGQLQGVTYEVFLRQGPVLPTLGKMIEEQNIDLVVLGTHGKGIAQKILIGSTAEQVFRQARVPVLTVGPVAEREPLYDVNFRNILFATEFGRGAEREAAYAFSLAQEHRSRLTMLHVLTHAKEFDEPVVVKATAASAHQMRELLPLDAGSHCLPRFRVETGNPVEEILRVSREIDADLIIIGAKPRKGLAGHLPHSKAYQVVCRAGCPVLTIKS